MTEACRGLGLPVIGGNVSLYNESGGHDIDPTPVVGLLGVVDSLVAPPPGWAWRDGRRRSCSWAPDTPNSHYRIPTRGVALGDASRPPRRQRAHFDAETLVADDRLRGRRESPRSVPGDVSDVTAVHDVGGGGLATALAEMVAVTGARRAARTNSRATPNCSREFPGRFVMATSDVAAFTRAGRAGGRAGRAARRVGGDELRIGSMIDLAVEEIAARRAARSKTSLAAVG